MCQIADMRMQSAKTTASQIIQESGEPSAQNPMKAKAMTPDVPSISNTPGESRSLRREDGGVYRMENLPGLIGS